MAIAKIALTDKLLQIYLLGLRIMEIAMQEPICGAKLNPKIVNKEATQLAAPLLTKVEELNFKARQDS